MASKHLELNEENDLEVDSDDDGSHKGQYGPIRKGREKNKQKHNESESRRRSRLRDKFLELRDAAGLQKKDRFNILSQSIEKLRAQEERIRQLEELSLKPAPILVKHEAPAPVCATATDLNSPLLANIPTAIVALDGRFRDCNAAFCQLLSTDRASLLTTSMFSFQHPSELLNTFTMVKKLLTGELKTWEAERKCVDGKGQSIAVHLTLAMVHEQGKPAFYIMLLLPKDPTALAARALEGSLMSHVASLPTQHAAQVQAQLMAASLAPAPSASLPAVPVPSTAAAVFASGQQQLMQALPLPPLAGMQFGMAGPATVAVAAPAPAPAAGASFPYPASPAYAPGPLSPSPDSLVDGFLF